jgi:hypothetical protein
MDAGVLFLDDLAATNALPRADAIAAADANGDGVVTMAELQEVTLEVAKESGGLYGVADAADVGDLGAFLEALARRTVTSFRARGACLVEEQP